jgi:hypothetical protein
VSSAAPAGRAEAFEGVLKWRLLKVSKAGVAKVATDPSDADAVFEVPMEKLMSLHGEATVTDATVYLKGSKMRTESTTREEGSYLITDLDTGKTQVVSVRDKKITEVTPEDMKQLGARAQGAKRLYEKRIPKDLSPEARKKLQGVLGDDGTPKPPPDVKAIDESATINGFKTEAYEVRAGKTTWRGWLTQDRPEIQEALQEIERRRSSFGQGAGNTPRAELGRTGLPVRVQTLSERDYVVEDLVLIDAKPLPEEIFTVPADFKRASGGPPQGPANAPRPRKQ